MIEILHRSTVKLSITLLLIVSMSTLAAPSAAASDKPGNKDDIRDGLSRATDTTTAATGSDARAVAAEPKISALTYGLYDRPSKLTPEIILPADQPQLDGILNRPAGVKPIVPPVIRTSAVKRLSTIPLPASTAAVSTAAVSTAPMTAGEKFMSWAKRFWSPGAYGGAIARGMWNELWDNDDNKEDTVGNYFADSMTRAARSYAFGTTAGFFEKFAYATIFKQDPRYHRSDKRSAGAKMKYAISRVFITQGDRCGCDQFNITFLAGGLTAAGIANVWEREERRGWGPTMSRWGYHTAFKALGNMIREFIGGQ
jgi:hypothetical protein